MTSFGMPSAILVPKLKHATRVATPMKPCLGTPEGATPLGYEESKGLLLTHMATLEGALEISGNHCE